MNINEKKSSFNKIFVVEDEEYLRNILIQKLQNYGFKEVQGFANGCFALENINNNIPDLIIVDYIMPMLNGIEFINILNQSNITKKIPIIMMSANYIKNTPNCFFLPKPFKISELLSLIDTIQHQIHLYQCFGLT